MPTNGYETRATRSHWTSPGRGASVLRIAGGRFPGVASMSGHRPESNNHDSNLAREGHTAPRRRSLGSCRHLGHRNRAAPPPDRRTGREQRGSDGPKRSMVLTGHTIARDSPARVMPFVPRGLGLRTWCRHRWRCTHLQCTSGPHLPCAHRDSRRRLPGHIRRGGPVSSKRSASCTLWLRRAAYAAVAGNIRRSAISSSGTCKIRNYSRSSASCTCSCRNPSAGEPVRGRILLLCDITALYPVPKTNIDHEN